MSSVIVEELVAVLEYRLENGKNAKKFGEEMDRLERKAKKHGTTIASAAKKSSDALERQERRKRESIKKTNKQMSASAKFIKNQGAAIAGLATGFGVVQGARFAKDSFVQFASLERQLTRIGITAGATRDEISKALPEIQKISIDLGFPDISQAVLALDTLTASGLDLKSALDFLPSVLATSQASGANTEDISNTAEKTSSSLNIMSKDMQEAFDIMVEGGKAGQFELKDMAQFLPSLASGFQAIGGTGLDGLRELIALLQTIRKRTGSSSAAATQMQNILSKINSPQTTNAFKKFGVDLDAGLDAARANGESLIDAFIKLTNIAIKGDTTKLSKLFTDQEFRLGMLALVNGEEDLRQFVETLNNSELKGGVFRDLKMVMQDTQADIDELSNNWDAFKTNLGASSANVFTPILKNVNQSFKDGRELERLRAEQKIIDEKNGIEGGFLSSLTEGTLDFRIAVRILENGGFEALRDSAISEEQKKLALNSKGVAVPFTLDRINQTPDEINKKLGFVKNKSSIDSENSKKIDDLTKKIEIISPGGVSAALRNDSNISNSQSNSQQTTNHINVEQNVTQATDAPGAAAEATASAIARLNPERAQLQIEPSQP